MAAAIGALMVVTLLVLHRPIGTTGGGALQAAVLADLRPGPFPLSGYWLTRGPSWAKGHTSGTGTGVSGAGSTR